MSKPVVAIVGRPNVGKSTLFNALAGERISIVQDTPGVTRDRIYAEVSWLDHNFTMIDTGGIEPDSNDIIFRYNAKAHAFSLIQADYLLQNDFEGNPVYLFLAKRNNDDTQVCRTFFPKSGTDYAEGQPRYTLLRKEKRNLENGDIIVQYDRLTPKQPKDQNDMREKYDRSAVSNGRLNPYIDRLK